MRITPRVCTSGLSFLIATDTCESANWSLFGAERWLLSEVSLYYECMEVIVKCYIIIIIIIIIIMRKPCCSGLKSVINAFKINRCQALQLKGFNSIKKLFIFRRHTFLEVVHLRLLQQRNI